MPLHDWARVSAGTYHDFHNSWITHLKEALNAGLPLKDMPLFLTKTHYVLTPLEATYQQAWAGVPRRWQRVIDTAAAAEY